MFRHALLILIIAFSPTGCSLHAPKPTDADYTAAAGELAGGEQAVYIMPAVWYPDFAAGDIQDTPYARNSSGMAIVFSDRLVFAHYNNMKKGYTEDLSIGYADIRWITAIDYEVDTIIRIANNDNLNSLRFGYGLTSQGRRTHKQYIRTYILDRVKSLNPEANFDLYY